MTSSLVTADSLLAIDIGTITTRALLFDVIGNQYRFIAEGSSTSTVISPFMDAGEGVRRAIDQLREVTGRIFMGHDGGIIIPSQIDGSGIDAVVLTMSAGPPIKIIAVGLLEGISVESAKNLAETTYGKVVETLSLNDRRKSEERIDTILAHRPDLIVLAGGIEGGATLSVRKMLESVGLAGFLLPKNSRPQVLFAGNESMQKEVEESLANVVNLHTAPNIRPTIDTEQLGPAKHQLAIIYKTIRSKQIHSVTELDAWSNGKLTPTSFAFERVVRFLSKIYDPVLGIDIGASATTIAASLDGESFLGVYPQLGLGENLPEILKLTHLRDISQWIHLDISDENVRDYIYNKSAFPGSIPTTEEEMIIEQAIARRVMQLALGKMGGSGIRLTPRFEPILAAGSIFTKAPNPGQSLLMLLDGLQPTGVSTILLDQNNIIPALGMAADVNPILAVQVLDSKTMLNLCAVVAPVGVAKHGTSILRVQMKYADGSSIKREIRFGSLEVLPLPMGETAELRLQPLHRFDVGAGPGRGNHLKVGGGIFGVVIDGRGRPIQLHADPLRRKDVLKKWLWTLGK